MACSTRQLEQATLSMFPLNLSRWNKVWLSKPWAIRPVPGTSMIELNGVKGFLTPGDVAFLFNLATEVPRGGCYLEVGSWLGLSAIVVANGLLANMNLQARVFCVDTWRGSAEHQALPEVRQDLLYEQFLRNVAEAQMEAFIQPLRGQSTEVAARWAGPDLDIVFIDGDHSLEGCYCDICAWRGLLKPGGRLLGHDAAPGSEVESAVRRFCAESGCTMTVHPLPSAHFIWEIHLQPSPTPPARAFSPPLPRSG
jgi:predicted O-methyltransferase YrrM